MPQPTLSTPLVLPPVPYIRIRALESTALFRAPPETLDMGFGSYDESEQKDQNVDTDEDKGVNVHENDHDGEVSFDSDADSDELIDKLQSMKDE
jgi:hypothetical protein